MECKECGSTEIELEERSAENAAPVYADCTIAHCEDCGHSWVIDGE